ncbi:hypothetical protein TNCV_1850291 [Trichonephila clavipes]|nr:hypothetical protein TNCV_1850291 [Trichonephila clavipes]
MSCGYPILLQIASNGTSKHQMTESAMVRDVAARPIAVMRTYRLSSRAVVKRGECDRPHHLLLHPAWTDPHHSCLVSSNALTYFSEGYSEILTGYYSSSVEFRNLVKRRLMPSLKYR